MTQKVGHLKITCHFPVDALKAFTQSVPVRRIGLLLWTMVNRIRGTKEISLVACTDRFIGKQILPKRLKLL